MTVKTSILIYGIVAILLSLPMAAGLVKPNGVYGFRVSGFEDSQR